MIIGYDFFNLGLQGIFGDTAISTSELDEVTLGTGIYDELFISVDTTIDATNVKPTGWQLKNIMDAKFQGDLEAGSLDADGHEITKIQIYRRKYNEEKEWLLVGEFQFDRTYNVYSFVDRLCSNNVTYEYAIVPIAKKVVGELTISSPVKVDFEGVFISDANGNFKMDIDFELGEVSYNTNRSYITPLNGKYPIMITGDSNYRSGNVTYLPLSDEQIEYAGGATDSRQERITREGVIKFLQKDNAKVIRKDDGEVIVVSVSDVATSPKNGMLADIHSLGFSYTEIGELDYDTMSRTGLIGSALKSNYTFDENGEIVWDVV